MAESEPTHIDSDRARAGVTPHMTRWILGISMVLVIVAFAIIVYV